MDFTLKAYCSLLGTLIEANYSFLTFENYIENKPYGKIIILRHDVDKMPANSLQIAKIEHELAIVGTYYFRIGNSSFDSTIIRQIASLGHEIGYHYEDLAICKGNMKLAIKNFEKNLCYFRQFYPVKTICMHGSPLSRYDNRLIWLQYNYRNYNIIGEPYFDIDFSEFLYLTDTGRCWNGDKFSVRDKSPIIQDPRIVINHLRSTFDIISSIQKGRLRNNIMITIHPQRWNNDYYLWIKELVMQNIKNVLKSCFVK